MHDVEAANRAYKYALSDYLQSQDWNYFFTTTFMYPCFRASTAIKRTIEPLQVYHVRSAFIAAEPHPDNPKIFHTHGLVRIGEGLHRTSAQGLWEQMFGYCGRSRVETIRGLSDVADYCAKYVVKGVADYDFWGDWGT